MNELIVNTFETSQVRTRIDELGQIWFVAQDVMDALGLKYRAHALRKLSDDERGGVAIHTETGKREFAAVSESGLYTLILSSNKPSAVRFKSWVTKEVLPSIRKTGSYSLTQKDMDPLDILENHLRKMRALQKANEEVAARVAQVEVVARQDDDTLTHDQISELDRLIADAARRTGDIKDIGRIRKKIKQGSFEIIGSRTYKEVPRRDFEKAKSIVTSYGKK